MRSLVLVLLASLGFGAGVPDASAGRRRQARNAAPTLRSVLGRELGAVWAVSDQAFDREVLQARGVVLVDFWATWCGYCTRIKPVVAETARRFAGRARVVQVNVDESPLTAARMRISSIPALLLFKDGTLVDGIMGAVSLPQVQALIERHLVPATP